MTDDLNLALAASFIDPMEHRSAFDLPEARAMRTAKALRMRIIGRRGYLTEQTPDLAEAMVERGMVRRYPLAASAATSSRSKPWPR